MDTKFKMLKMVSAILFQYTIIGILTYSLITGIGGDDMAKTIIGALVGLAVGIGINSISE